jgi:hypothetical protein
MQQGTLIYDLELKLEKFPCGYGYVTCTYMPHSLNSARPVYVLVLRVSKWGPETWGCTCIPMVHSTRRKTLVYSLADMLRALCMYLQEHTIRLQDLETSDRG